MRWVYLQNSFFHWILFEYVYKFKFCHSHATIVITTAVAITITVWFPHTDAHIYVFSGILQKIRNIKIPQSIVIFFASNLNMTVSEWVSDGVTERTSAEKYSMRKKAERIWRTERERQKNRKRKVGRKKTAPIESTILHMILLFHF